MPNLTVPEFSELKKNYQTLTLSDVYDIPWGRMTDDQFTEFKAKLTSLPENAKSERNKQIRENVFPTRQPDGKWVRPLTWQHMTAHPEKLFSHDYFDYMPEHWFSYFFFDAKGNTNVGEQKNFLVAAREVFIYDKQSQGARLRPELNGLLRNAPADKICALLQATLECGFTRVAMPSHQANYNADVLVRNFSRWLGGGSNANRMKIGWRCETRGYRQVLDSGGLNRQVVAAIRRRTLHFDQPWHPFSKPENLNCFWYRRTNRDNDNYLVVSVAHSFNAAVCFPKIEEGFAEAANHESDLEKWPPNVLADLKHNIGLVHFRDGTAKWKIIQQVNVFLFLVEGDFFDTEAYQTQRGDQGFPEWGVSQIDPSAIWGAIPVTKVYHGLTDADGFTAIIDVAAAHSQTQPLDERRHKFSLNQDQWMLTQFDTVLATPCLGLKWTSSGPEEGNELKGDKGGSVRLHDPVEKGGLVPKGHVKLMKEAWDRKIRAGGI